MNTDFDDLVFVLGNQRSGTTWLANIIDSSPDTLLLMEPFAPGYGLFDQFPEEFYYISPPSEYCSQLLRDGILRLLRYKSVFFDPLDISPIALRLESSVMNVLIGLNRRLSVRRLDFASRYKRLNLNRLNDSFLMHLKKHRHPRVWVVKELRLAGKVGLIADTFPEAKFVLIVRHPCAVVHSVLNWFQKGSLSELRRNMNTYLEKIEGQAAFQQYRRLIDLCKRKGLEYRLALYWRINNEIIVEQFQRVRHSNVLIYEGLASNPLMKTQELFDFLGLALHPNVERYVDFSSNRATKSPGPIETTRVSAEYYKQWHRSIPNSLEESVMEVVAGSPILPLIEPFYDTC